MNVLNCTLIAACLFSISMVKTQEYTLKTVINNPRISIYLLDQNEKQIGVARGTEFRRYIDLGFLYITNENDRQKGHGKKILTAFLNFARANNKPVFAMASPIGNNWNTPLDESIDRLVKFYQKYGNGLVMYKDHQAAYMVFQQHLVKF